MREVESNELSRIGWAVAAGSGHLASGAVLRTGPRRCAHSLGHGLLTVPLARPRSPLGRTISPWTLRPTVGLRGTVRRPCPSEPLGAVTSMPTLTVEVESH